MATVTGVKAAHATLSSTTVDTVTLSSLPRTIEVLNRSGTDPLWVSTDVATAPVAAAAETYVVPAGSALEINDVGSDGSVKILGNGNAYSVTAVPS